MKVVNLYFPFQVEEDEADDIVDDALRALDEKLEGSAK